MALVWNFKDGQSIRMRVNGDKLLILVDEEPAHIDPDITKIDGRTYLEVTQDMLDEIPDKPYVHKMDGKLYVQIQERIASVTEMPSESILSDEDITHDLNEIRTFIYAPPTPFEFVHYYENATIHMDIWLRQQYEFGRISHEQFVRFRTHNLKDFLFLVRKAGIIRHNDPDFFMSNDDMDIYNPNSDSIEDNPKSSYRI